MELLVVIVVVAIVSGIVAVVTGGALEKARLLKSTGNLRSIGVGVANYMADHNNTYPLRAKSGWSGPYWTDYVEPYLEDPVKGAWRDQNGREYAIAPAFVDPLLDNDAHHNIGDYGAHNRIFVRGLTEEESAAGQALVRVRGEDIYRPGRTIMVTTAEVTSGEREIGSWFIEIAQFIPNPDNDRYARPSDRGTGNVLALFCDGHTESIPMEELKEKRRDYFLLEP
jgi:general secretion pathway protein G